MIRSEKKEGLTLFQTLNVLRVPMKVNTQRMEYSPIISLSNFWSMNSELTQINKTHDGNFNFTLYLSFNYIRRYFFSQIVTHFKIKTLLLQPQTMKKVTKLSR